MSDRTTGPLAGLRVVEMGQYLAAPLVGLLLADQGAEVVRVSRPGAPETPGDVVLHRGKRRLWLDLQRPADARAAREIVARADVLVEGFRPGVLDRMGIDPDAIRARDNPGLVSCSLPGFAPDDARAWLPAWEGAVSAMAGLYERSLHRNPVFTRLPLASLGGALYGANAIAAALYVRERDGRGQHAEVPLYDATFALQELTALLTVRPPRAWPTLRWAANPLVGTYRCKDGRWLQIHPADTIGWIERIGTLGHAAEAAALGRLLGDGAADDPLAGASIGYAWRLRRALAALFRLRDAADWEEALGDVLALAAVRTGAEWLRDPQAKASGLVVSVDDPALGPVAQTGLPVRLERGPTRPRPRSLTPSVPNDFVSTWPPSQPALPLAGAEGAPLAGLRVLDLGPPLAGPLAARTLAELGAEVLRVEIPGATGAWAGPMHIASDTGKRSVALDPHGSPDTFWRVVDHFAPDIVVDAGGVAEAAGIGEAAFRARFPGIVWTRVTAYGPTGPWAGRPGTELTVQAATGIQAEQGGDGPPRWLAVPLVEIGTGLLAAYGTMLALLQRRRTGKPQRVDASLAATATLAQSPWLFDHAGRAPDESPGADALGSGPLDRFYEARDGWMFFAAPEDALADLATLPGLSALQDARRERWEGLLTAAFATAAVSVWQARVELAGLSGRVAIVHRHRPGQAMGDPRALTRDLVRFREHAGVGRVTETGPPIRLSRTPLAHLPPAHAPGSDTRPMLEELSLPIPDDAPPLETDVPDSRGGLATDIAWLGEQARWGLFVVASRAARRLAGS